MNLLNKIGQLSIALAILLLLLITQRVFVQNIQVLKILFIIFGSFGTIVSFYYAYQFPEDAQFNWIFWIGIGVNLFACFLFIQNDQRFIYVLIGGSFITGVSYFIKSKTKGDSNNENLLDR